VGTLCVDKYEASLWNAGNATKRLLKKMLQGNATLADLQAGGAVELNTYTDQGVDPTASPFPGDGHWIPLPGSNPPSPGVYALSVAGASPSLATWAQAQQGCALSGKRLLTIEEWRRAAIGTPDPGPRGPADPSSCNHFFDWPPYPAGSRPKCVSSWGVFDLVGNFGEWVADLFVPALPDSPNQPAPAPRICGIAGAEIVETRYLIDVDVNDGIGFRCAR
jgi:hypothetical protein